MPEDTCGCADGCPCKESQRLMENGRRLASERDDLIAAGVDPAELAVPIAPVDLSARDGVIFHAESRPATPPPHVHRWAWAQLVSGGERQVCYDCGVERM